MQLEAVWVGPIPFRGRTELGRPDSASVHPKIKHSFGGDQSFGVVAKTFPSINSVGTSQHNRLSSNMGQNLSQLPSN